MEIGQISSSSTVKAVQSKPTAQISKPQDTLAISKEAEKMGRWVEMLKEMPSIRSEKIESALKSEAQQNFAKVYAAIAQELQNENGMV